MFDTMFSFVRMHKRPSIIALSALLLMFYAGFVRAPQAFPEGGIVFIEKGVTVAEAGRLLEAQHVVRSSAFFSWLVKSFGIEGGVRSGTYVFEHPASVFSVAKRLNRGEFGSALVRVTIPEGSNVREMGDILETHMPGFDKVRFVEKAAPYEGYLFPDTYLFAPGVTADTVIVAMRDNFDEQVASLKEDITAFGAPLEDVVVMASLLEKEARQYETKRLVSGILWKRLDIGMPLQVDAVFGYIFGTTTFSPTFDQLEIDSPYNTYLYPGLPPGPIANPGLDSLKAAVNPEPSPFLYYLTGSDGTMHYAKTFDEHVANRRFLKK